MFSLLVVFLATNAFAWGKAVPLPSNDGRIVGGENVTIEEYPYQISLEYRNQHHCGGSIIKPNIILTAAHCTDSSVKPSDLTVRAGSTIKETGGQVVQVVSIYNHPKYGTTASTDYDVAVLGLDRSLTLGVGVQTISLHPKHSEVPDGTMAVVSGWGLLSSGGESPTNLQAVEVPKVSHESCVESYGKSITDRMICFGYKEGGKDSCQQDSGGPLVVQGVQVGVVSWGMGCALPNYPGVYAKVSHEEITDHINESIASIEKY